MTKVTVDRILGRKLGNLSGPAEICDPSGRAIGHFVPLSGSEEIRQAQEQCPYNEGELLRLRKQRGGRTLPEIWESLGRK